MKVFLSLAAVLIVGGVAAAWFYAENTSTPVAPGLDLSQMTDGQTSGTPIDIPETVATVNGTTITGDQYQSLQAQILAGQGLDAASIDAQMQSLLQTQVLDSLVSQAVLNQAVAEANIEIADTNIDAQLEQVRGQFVDEATYEQALAAEGLTEAELRTQIRSDLAAETYLEQTLNLSSLTVDETEVEATYERLAAEQEVPPLDEVRGEVEQVALQQKQQEVIGEHLAELRAAADVEIMM